MWLRTAFCPFLCLAALLGKASSRLHGASNWRAATLSQDDDPSNVQLPLTRTKEGWYAAEVRIAGSPAHLLVDTGSSVMWARAATSEGSKAPVGNFTAQYGRGAVSGEVVAAGVALSSAGSSKPRSCRVGRPIEEGAFWSRQRSIDGVLGLGCSDEGASIDALACVVPPPAPRPLDLFGPRPRRVFCLQLTPSGGTLTLGSVPRAVQLNLVSMPAAPECGHWTVPLLALGVKSGSAAPQRLVGDADAVLDSGSDGVVGPTFAVIELARRLGASAAKPGEGYGGEVTFYQVPCDAADNLPSVSLQLGDAHGATVTVELRGSDLVSVGREGEESCHLRVVGWETQSWILGAVFLSRLQGVVFDVDNGAVAIAPPPP